MQWMVHDNDRRALLLVNFTTDAGVPPEKCDVQAVYIWYDTVTQMLHFANFPIRFSPHPLRPLPYGSRRSS